MRDHWGKIIALIIGLAVGFGFGSFKEFADESAAADGGKAGSKRERTLSALVEETAVKLGIEEREQEHPLVSAFSKPITNAAGFDAYTADRGFSKESLLAVIHLDHDPGRHLAKAAELFPDDPQIQFLILVHNAFPDESGKWIERFKESAPDNALASLFSAKQKFKSGDPQAAIEQLRLASQQGGRDDFRSASLMASDAALLEFGFTPLEAKARGTFLQSHLFLGDFQKVLFELRKVVVETTGVEAKVELASLGTALANEYTQGEAKGTLIHRLIGLNGETAFLKLLDPDLQSPNLSATPAELLRQLEVEQAEITEFTSHIDDIADSPVHQLLSGLSEDELTHYLDRVRASGELEALRWVRERNVENLSE